MKNALYVFGILVFTGIYGQDRQEAVRKKAETTFDKALEIRFRNPDSAAYLLDASYKKYMQIADTVNATNSLLEKATIFENNARYSDSYDALWKALLLNDGNEDAVTDAVLYNRLGRIYSYYKRENTSLEFLKRALEIQKKMEREGTIPKENLAPYYYSLAATYRELNRKELGQVYLDSSYLYYSEKNETIAKAYLEFEKANLLLQNGEHRKAIATLEAVYPWFEENLPSYLVLFYKYWGDMYLGLSDLAKSEELYKKSLQVSKDYKSHIDFTPLVHERLTEVYLRKNDLKSAFANLKRAKELDALFFDGRSSNNQSLLEIKDNYRAEKERQEKRLQAQNLRQLEQEAEIINLQRIILFISVLSLLIIGYFYIKNLRIRHRTEKQLIERKKELEIQRSKELIDLKNRELAASALQLAEKDEFFRNLKTKIREGDPIIKKSELNKILRSMSVDNTKTWEEFRLRFIDVNKKFYDKIFERYPNLSQNDQKICALIKLNMSSKDMSRLLGISVESVHTSRHRIRKKMGLPRNINLEDFIANL